jgi:hypothetical protein
MKVSRVWLLRITGGIGVFIIAYSLIRHFTGFSIGETAEKYLFDTIVFLALGLFMYNRKLAADEKKEREAREKAEAAAAAQAAEDGGDPASAGEPEADAEAPEGEGSNTDTGGDAEAGDTEDGPGGGI